MARELSQTPNAIKCRERYARNRQVPEFVAAQRARGRARSAEQRAKYKSSPEYRALRALYAKRALARQKERTGRAQWPGALNRHLIRTYGITLAQRDEILRRQGGVCGLCRGGPAGSQGRWHVDHDHNTDAVRGVLCHRCNVNLGAHERLIRIVGLPAVESYLSAWPAGDDMSAVRSA